MTQTDKGVPFCTRQSHSEKRKSKSHTTTILYNVNVINMCHFSFCISFFTLKELSVLSLLPSADDTSRSMLLQNVLIYK